jgi:hypothetical protein
VLITDSQCSSQLDFGGGEPLARLPLSCHSTMRFGRNNIFAGAVARDEGCCKGVTKAGEEEEEEAAEAEEGLAR